MESAIYKRHAKGAISSGGNCSIINICAIKNGTKVNGCYLQLKRILNGIFAKHRKLYGMTTWKFCAIILASSIVLYFTAKNYDLEGHRKKSESQDMPLSACLESHFSSFTILGKQSVFLRSRAAD